MQESQDYFIHYRSEKSVSSTNGNIWKQISHENPVLQKRKQVFQMKVIWISGNSFRKGFHRFKYSSHSNPKKNMKPASEAGSPR